MDINNLKFSIVVPLRNEESNIDELYTRLTNTLSKNNYSYEILCISDGSTDNTLNMLKDLHKRDERVKVIDLSRNFGKEIAMSAGLQYCSGDAVIVIDADLQDPPEIIPELIGKWLEGYDVVYATRTIREGETWIKKLTAKIFYKLMRLITNIDIPADTGDFRIMSSHVVDSLNMLPEQHRFMKGLFSWVGYKQTGIKYNRESRHAGVTNFNLKKLWNFALEGITSFSFIPLRLATYMGFVIAFLSIIYLTYLVIRTLIYGNPVPGYTSLMVSILFFGGVQFIFTGIIGEYIGRIYNETKRRPLFFIREQLGFNDNKESKY